MNVNTQHLSWSYAACTCTPNGVRITDAPDLIAMLTDACDASLHFISPFSKKSAFFAGENLVLYHYLIWIMGDGACTVSTFHFPFSIFSFPFSIRYAVFCHSHALILPPKKMYLCRLKCRHQKDSYEKLRSHRLRDRQRTTQQRVQCGRGGGARRHHHRHLLLAHPPHS